MVAKFLRLAFLDNILNTLSQGGPPQGYGLKKLSFLSDHI
jgi:hypothetical protein